MIVKDLLKKQLERKMQSDFDAKVEKRAVTFDSWIRERESSLERYDMTVDGRFEGGSADAFDIANASFSAKYEEMTLRIVPYSKITSGFKVKNYIEDIIVFVNGELTDKAIPLLVKRFRENAEADIIYGDEDIATLDVSDSLKYGRSVYGTRRDPYFKPDWSPNTFLDHFYFCNVVAIRRNSFRDYEWATGYDGAMSLYHTLLSFIFKDEKSLRRSVDHIDEILVHAKDYELNLLKQRSGEDFAKEFLVLDKDVTRISIIIPSKDNPHLIKKCLDSLINTYDENVEYEVIVVDNGSLPENRRQMEALSELYGFSYIYNPMEFNFATMINMGAAEAKYEILLLLNDDITFRQDRTLERVANVVKYSFSGAVGAKLLYPYSEMIQHAGVFNNRIGPVHKLQYSNDSREYYNGFNKTVNNVLAVTGAFLCVRRDVFEKVRGMNESFRVAFNDVDFCFRLIEAGYTVTVRNDVILEHAESVTRGKDVDENSIVRLMSEKDRLYALHPSLKGYDPYYSKNLQSDCLDVRIADGSEYQYMDALEEADRVRSFDLSRARLEPCVQLSLEYAGSMENFSFDEKDSEYMYFQGFSYVSGSDNACFLKRLLLTSEKDSYVLSFEGAVRNDVSLACNDQTNVLLSGFSVKINKKSIKPGRYRVGALHEKKYSKEKLYIYSNKYIEIQ